MKNKKLLKTKKDLKRWIKDTSYFKNVKQYKDLWFKNQESAIVVTSKNDDWHPQFHDNWADPIWVEGYCPLMHFDDYSPNPGVYFLDKEDACNPTYDTKQVVALCHPYITYFDEEGDRLIRRLPFKKSKLVSTVLDIMKEFEVIYISSLISPDGFHKKWGYESPSDNPTFPLEEYEYMNT